MERLRAKYLEELVEQASDVEAPVWKQHIRGSTCVEAAVCGSTSVEASVQGLVELAPVREGVEVAVEGFPPRFFSALTQREAAGPR